MKFKATDEQIQKIAVNAVNAAKPMGMGFFHYQDVDYKPENIEITTEKDYKTQKVLKQVYIDYFMGRCTKLNLREVDNGIWETPQRKLDGEYQTWKCKYPTWEDLVKSVTGVKIL